MFHCYVCKTVFKNKGTGSVRTLSVCIQLDIRDFLHWVRRNLHLLDARSDGADHAVGAHARLGREPARVLELVHRHEARLVLVTRAPAALRARRERLRAPVIAQLLRAIPRADVLGCASGLLEDASGCCRSCARVQNKSNRFELQQ